MINLLGVSDLFLFIDYWRVFGKCFFKGFLKFGFFNIFEDNLFDKFCLRGFL